MNIDFLFKKYFVQDPTVSDKIFFSCFYHLCNYVDSLEFPIYSARNLENAINSNNIISLEMIVLYGEAFFLYNWFNEVFYKKAIECNYNYLMYKDIASKMDMNHVQYYNKYKQLKDEIKEEKNMMIDRLIKLQNKL